MPVILDQCPKCPGQKDSRAEVCRSCFSLATPTTKICRNCKQEKEIDKDFRMRTRKIPRPRSICKDYEATNDKLRRDAMPLSERKKATRDWEKNNPDKHYRGTLRRRCRLIGIMEAEIPFVVELALSVKGCQICGRTVEESGGANKKSLSIDHCHSTGRFRGLLCPSCNLAIGHFQDSPELLEKAASYLRGHHNPLATIRPDSHADTGRLSQ